MPTVLLVNTQPVLRALLEKRFTQEGFGVHAASWDQGLELLREARPDLVVLGQDEQHSPEAWLEACSPCCPALILLTTGESGQESAPGEVARLRMPFRPSDLLALARKAVTG